jgi:hypothetical protein
MRMLLLIISVLLTVGYVISALSQKTDKQAQNKSTIKQVTTPRPGMLAFWSRAALARHVILWCNLG